MIILGYDPEFKADVSLIVIDFNEFIHAPEDTLIWVTDVERDTQYQTYKKNIIFGEMKI